MGDATESSLRCPEPVSGAERERNHDGAGVSNFINNRIAQATSQKPDYDRPLAPNGTVEPVVPPEKITETANGYGDEIPAVVKEEQEIMCGPLLNYKGMSGAGSELALWHGSIVLVTKPGHHSPKLKLKCLVSNGEDTLDVVDRPDTARNDVSRAKTLRYVIGEKLYEDWVKAFWRFDIDVPLQECEASWEYTIASTLLSGASPRSRTFVVPSTTQSMRIMFHSCNGFSIGTDEEAWSGPALWNDVMRLHEQKPFHCMIGGGDQVYNDGVRVGDGPLKSWTNIGNPKRRRDYPFNEELRAACDSWYFESYVNWYSTGSFALANSQIPQINIWDDHGTFLCFYVLSMVADQRSDIIDGFGSYTDHFMKCAVFHGIGGVAFKYYCLFQHHIPPSKSTFMRDVPQTTEFQGADGTGADPRQLPNATFVLKERPEDRCFLKGGRPGPYIDKRSRSLYMRLGARVGFLGIDARTERTRHQVNYPDTYDLIFTRVQRELASSGPTKMTHLIVLLGVPIAYPRLMWLESIFKSPIIGPIRFLSKRFGIAGDLFNKFDGQVDLLDDLDDHYTARQHKHERKDLITRLQDLAYMYSIRITILSGDVHLAAVGRFYAKPKLGIPAEHDHRYMPNVISSAITNHPPPGAIADLLARRNKIHHLDHDTDETLMKIWDKDPGGVAKNSNFNKVTMPSRNYAVLSESENTSASPHPSEVTLTVACMGGTHIPSPAPPQVTGTRKDGHLPLHPGEEAAGTSHRAASGVYEGAEDGALDVCFRVEIDKHDKSGKTEGYGFSSKSSS